MEHNLINDEEKHAYFFYGVTEYAYRKNFKIILDRRSFSGPNLLKSREEAYEWQDKRKGEIEGMQDMLIPQNPQLETIYLKTVIDLCLIQYTDKNDQKEFYLEGRGKDEIDEGRRMEKTLYKVFDLVHPNKYSS
jgi:hypothetical protein